MYIYQIKNKINNKLYIGQTNNIQKRWNNHKCCNDSKTAIARAIRKYGVKNFSFEILYRNLSLEEANLREIETIKEKNTKIPNGYNIAEGGKGTPGVQKLGAENSNAKLTEKEAQFLLDNRDQPCYTLYELYKDKISYEQFKKIYHHKAYQNLTTTTKEYPYNIEFSNQFSKIGLEYDEVLDIRERYLKHEYWEDVWKDYKDIYSNKWSFWNAYNGKSYKLVRPEVFTEENKKIHTKLGKTGSRNGRAKLTEKDVLNIRKLNSEGVSNSEIYKIYPQVSPTTIREIINKKTWKHLL